MANDEDLINRSGDAPLTVHNLRPDDVVLIGNLGSLADAEVVDRTAELQRSLPTARGLYLFARDIDVELAPDPLSPPEHELVDWVREQIAADWARADELARDPFEGLSDDELHQRRAHPAYEYRTTEGQRKAWDQVDEPPWDDELGRPGDGWELNITSRDTDAWERFDYIEERYWRRCRPGGPYVREVPREALELRARCEAYGEIVLKYEGARLAEQRRPGDESLRWYAIALGSAVLAVALAYREREGYKPEWRP